MKIEAILTDQSILQELGARLAAARLERNFTQETLAEQAGISKRTLERLEAGEVATQLAGFVRVCRVLGLLERLDTLVPQATLSPIALFKLRNRQRRRASVKNAPVGEPPKWTWGKSP
jgi:transcriptional regulator with XRE-family HTH domain